MNSSTPSESRLYGDSVQKQLRSLTCVYRAISIGKGHEKYSNAKSHIIGFTVAFLEKYDIEVLSSLLVPPIWPPEISGYFPSLRRNYMAESSNLMRMRLTSAYPFSKTIKKKWVE